VRFSPLHKNQQSLKYTSHTFLCHLFSFFKFNLKIMTKNHLNTSQIASDPPLTCDVDGIIAGLDYESFVLLPGTRNPRPGMKFAEDTEALPEEITDYQMDYSASVYESPSLPSMYFYPPPPYWGAQFMVASPRLDGKKSKKKNKKKRNKNKQRLQRLERESQLGVTTPTSDQSISPSPLSSPSLSSKTPDSPSLSPKSDQKSNKKKRNKQRRRGSGRARRASAPQYMLHEGVDAMSLQFAGLGVGLPDAPVATTGEVASGFPKSGTYSPLNRYSSSRHPPFWNQVPLYGQAY